MTTYVPKRPGTDDMRTRDVAALDYANRTGAGSTPQDVWRRELLRQAFRAGWDAAREKAPR